MRVWLKRMVRGGRGAAPGDGERSSPFPEVGEWQPPDPLPPKEPIDVLAVEYDLVRDSRHAATVVLPFSPAKVGAYDGRAEVPRGLPHELPPAITLIRQHGRVEMGRVREAYLARRDATLARRAQLLADREEREKRHIEATVAYEQSEGFPFEPRYRSLDEARNAPPRDDDDANDDSTQAQVELSRGWHIAQYLYWLSTVVLIGAEFPLSYSLADDLIPEAGGATWQAALRIILAVSITVAILVTVKLIGTLFRRAQTLFQLARDLRRIEERARPVQDTGFLDGGFFPDADPAIPPAHTESNRAAWVRAGIAIALTVMLTFAAFELAEYRGAAFANAAQDRAFAAALEQQQGGLEAVASAAIGREIDEALLQRLFLAILGLSLAAGIALAWASTDPAKERRPAHGKGAGHIDLRRTVDDARRSYAAVVRDLAAVEVALAGLDDHYETAQERVEGAIVASESAYWQANLANRMFVHSDDFLLWMTDVVGAPPPPPPLSPAAPPSPPPPPPPPAVAVGPTEEP